MGFILNLRGCLLVCLFVSLNGASPAWADTESPWKTFSIKAGGYFPIQDTNVRVDGTGGFGLGTEIDFENDLNLDEETWLRAKAWALWKATFELTHIEDKTSPEAAIQKEIIDDVLV